MRLRITVRGDGVELRGFLDVEVLADSDPLAELARWADRLGAMVVASAQPDDWRPSWAAEVEP